MKTVLNLLALLVALATFALWVGTGAHLGWTRTSVTLMRTDAVTGLEYPEMHRQFVLGVEWLGAGLAAAAVLGGISLLFKSTPNQPN